MKARPTLRERLSSRRALLGLMQRYPHPALAELAGQSGYDFIILDDEHGIFLETDHLHTLWAVSTTEMAVFVRLRGHDLQAVGRYLDLGIDGLLIPNVSTAAQAREFVRAMEYPPAGTRGFGASAHRASRYGLDISTHVANPRAGAALFVIIESALGVANIEEILTVPGLDGVIVGPWDLSADVGGAGNFSNTAYDQALLRVERSAVANGKVIGTAPHTGYPLERLIASGHRLLILGTDISLAAAAMKSELSKAKTTATHQEVIE